MDRQKLSLIVSVYNEEASLCSFYKVSKEELSKLDIDYELIFVDDGSKDKSKSIIERLAGDDKNIKCLSFSRNFGHEAAMIAGIDKANGDFIICMDADLQHPPSCIKYMLEKFYEGFEVINMARTENKDAGFIKNMASNAFYTVINKLSDAKLKKNASDFFGISKRVADVLRSNYREKIRFLRAYVQNVGFKSVSIEYEAAARVAGKSKYSIKKLFKFSINAIMCFSDLPLKLGLYAGFFSALLGVFMMIYTIFTWWRVGTPNGYATIIVLICFMFAVMFAVIGIIGEYISVMFLELKDRPIYIIEDEINFKD